MVCNKWGKNYLCKIGGYNFFSFHFIGSFEVTTITLFNYHFVFDVNERKKKQTKSITHIVYESIY